MKTTNHTLQEKALKLKKQRRRQLLASLLGIVLLLWGVVEVVCMFLDYKHTETSNDAQVEQYISPVNLRASGYIKKIYFTEHQQVNKGDTLLVLDDREYRIRVMEAEAALKDAMAGATVMDATLQTTQTTASVYEASIAEIEIRLAKLEKDRQRYENLLKRNAATPIQLEQIETEYEATRKKLEATRRQQRAAMSGVKEVSNRKESTEAAIQRAKAALEMARLNLSYTVVLAPCDGKLGRLGRRAVHHCRTKCNVHSSGQSEMDCGQLQGNAGREPEVGAGSTDCRRCPQWPGVYRKDYGHLRSHRFQVFAGTYRQFCRQLCQDSAAYSGAH